MRPEFSETLQKPTSWIHRATPIMPIKVLSFELDHVDWGEHHDSQRENDDWAKFVKGKHTKFHSGAIMKGSLCFRSFAYGPYLKKNPWHLCCDSKGRNSPALQRWQWIPIPTESNSTHKLLGFPVPARWIKTRHEKRILTKHCTIKWYVCIMHMCGRIYICVVSL